MKNFAKKIRFDVRIAFLALVLAALVGAYSVSADDTSTTRVIGYAWSSNIGWVSFNDGTVSVDDSGNMTGYAWSSNIGWVKFGGLTGFPDSSRGGNAKIDDSGNITGWARVVSVMNPLTYKTIDNRGGWDGWISLSSNGKSPAYGVSVTNKAFKGFAWGSDVVGWLDWSKVKEVTSDLLCQSANGLLEDGETTVISTKITSGADKGKCQTQTYLCKSQVLTAQGQPSAPASCTLSSDCDARDGIALKNGETHKFFKERVVVGGSCLSQNVTCTDGVLVGPDGTADESYMYANCVVAPSYTEK